jgi:Mg-chelatase subunit ChlD
MTPSSPARALAPRDGQSGAVTLPLIALGMSSLLLILVLSLNSGLATLGRTQLQVVADNAARAGLLAIGEANRNNPNTPIPVLQRLADQNARRIAEGNTVVQGGIDGGSSDLRVELGRFNLASGAFTTARMMDIPTAVRVTARRAAGAASGSFRSLIPLRDGGDVNDVQSEATAVAALRCKSVVFIIDVSGSFAANIDTVQGAVRNTIGLLQSPDAVGIVVFSGAVIEQTTPAPGGMDMPREVTSMQLRAPEDDDLLAQIDTISDPTVRFSPRVGSDIGAGLARAAPLLDQGSERCEKLAVLLSDGAVNAPGGFPAARAAAARLAGSGSIATVAIGAFGEGRRFLDDIVSGFGQMFPANFVEEDLANKTLRAISTVPPILVR